MTPDGLMFIAHCSRCGMVLDVIPTDDDWRAAEAWAYLAAVHHRSECPDNTGSSTATTSSKSMARKRDVPLGLIG
jgi:hypothetical protein